MSYAAEIQRARRLNILLNLFMAPGYTASLQVLRAQGDAAGYVMSHDLIDSELAWLREQGYLDTLPAGAHRLTDRGQDVALGRAQVPGVRRPSPDELPPY